MRLLQWVGIYVLAGGLLLASGGAAWAQGGSGSGSGGSGNGDGSGGGYGGAGGMGQLSPSSVQGMGTDDMPPISPRLAEDQIKLRNIERQKQLVDDTQKLVALANELKSDVAKSTKDTLSLDVVRKADEIEKLAHNVKERMKNAN